MRKWYLIGFVNIETDRIEFAELFSSRTLSVIPHRGMYDVELASFDLEHAECIEHLKFLKSQNHTVFNKWIQLFNKYPHRQKEEMI